MNATYERRLQKNIVKYSWYKVFTKRLYLPLITLQLVTVGNVTLEQLALIVIISSIVQAVLQMPAAYVADKIGNRKSIILGASIAVLSPLLYAFMPNFWGGLIASLLFFGGYAFQSGSIEAFMHNTLIALKREKDYAKVMGRAQTYGLVANVILIAIVPATYAINQSLPFIIGFISLAAMLWLTIIFEHPKIAEQHSEPKSPLRAIRSIVNPQNIVLFIFSGFLAGVVFRGGEFRELLFVDLGIDVVWFGVIIALGSLAGAAMGWFVHILDRMKPMSFYLFDLLFITACFVIIGVTTNAFVAITGFTLFAGYMRVRMIIFQAKMLHDITHAYKATLISALNMFTLIGDIVAITLLTQFVVSYGYSVGHVLFGLAVFVISIVVWMVMLVQYSRKHKAHHIADSGV